MYGQYGMMNYDPSMFESPFVRKLKQMQAEKARKDNQLFNPVMPENPTQSYSQNYEQGQGNDPFTAQSAFLQHLQTPAPRHEDYKAGFGRTALGAISAGLLGYAGNPNAVEIGSNVINKKYNTAMFDWQSEGKRLGQAAGVESGLFDQDLRRKNFDLQTKNTFDDNIRADAARKAADEAALVSRRESEARTAEIGAVNFDNVQTGMRERHFPDGRIVILGQTALTPEQKIQQTVKTKEAEQPLELQKIAAQGKQTQQNQAAAEADRTANDERLLFLRNAYSAATEAAKSPTTAATTRDRVARMNELVARVPEAQKFWSGSRVVMDSSVKYKEDDVALYDEMIKQFYGGPESKNASPVPSSAAPASTATGQTPTSVSPPKPASVIEEEKRTGLTYFWNGKTWASK